MLLSEIVLWVHNIHCESKKVKQLCSSPKTTSFSQIWIWLGSGYLAKSGK